MGRRESAVCHALPVGGDQRLGDGDGDVGGDGQGKRSDAPDALGQGDAAHVLADDVQVPAPFRHALVVDPQDAGRVQPLRLAHGRLEFLTPRRPPAQRLSREDLKPHHAALLPVAGFGDEERRRIRAGRGFEDLVAGVDDLGGQRTFSPGSAGGLA